MTEKNLYSRIYYLICCVPCGRVTTYGEIARQLGTTARVVGFALAALPGGHNVPWQRVINSKGQVSRRSDGDSSNIQRLLLEAEGVCFDERDTVDLEKYRWPSRSNE